MPILNWLKSAVVTTNKPKSSIISVLKKNLGVMREGRDRSIVHASDITKSDFCPRQWAFLDLQGVKSKPEYISTALNITFTMGLVTEKLLIEEWAGNAAIGNWKCRRCGEQRSMCSKPKRGCVKHQDCQWQYQQLVVLAPEFNVSGAIDCLFDLSVPLWVVTEIKTLNPVDFDNMVAPQPEHRIRTALYLKLLSSSPYADKINLHEARVLYISRGYGKANHQFKGEVLPLKEFVVQRDDFLINPFLQRAIALKMYRDTGKMCSGICSTATDTYAKKCSVVVPCFSGMYPALVKIEDMKVS